MIQGFSLSFNLLLLLLDFFHLPKFLINFLFKNLNVSFVDLEPVFHELNIFLFEVDDGHVLFGFFVHFIVIFSEGVEIIGEDGFLIDFGGGVDFLEEVLEHEILLGVIESFTEGL